MIVKATYESTNFTFTAYGETETHAVNTLKRGLDQHTTDYGLDVGWWHKFSNDIFVEEIQLNEAYRDHELLKVAP
jgi:hypothetical protein